MIYSSEQLPLWLLGMCNVLMAGLWVFAGSERQLWQRVWQWRSLLLFGLLLFLWGIRIDVGEGASAGMSFHLMGMVLACLVLSWRTAWMLMGLIWWLIYGPSVWQSGDWLAVAPNLLLALLPAWLLAPLAWRVWRSLLPTHLFVFIFAHAFITAGLSMLVTGVFNCVVLWLTGRFAAFVVWEQILPIYVLLLWGEAFLTGLLVAVMVAFQPQWLDGYSDEQYLPPKPPSLW